MRLALLMGALLLSAAPVLAERTTIEVGPFNVSFDVNLSKGDFAVQGKSTVNIAGSQPIEAFYINNMENGGSIRVGITPLEGFQLASNNMTDILRQATTSADPSARLINPKNYSIDGCNGVVGQIQFQSGAGTTLNWIACYAKDNIATVQIVSTVPWDGGMKRLVDSIHVERADKSDTALNQPGKSFDDMRS